VDHHRSRPIRNHLALAGRVLIEKGSFCSFAAAPYHIDPCREFVEFEVVSQISKGENEVCRKLAR
jgi:hypothetical protein